MTDTNTLQAETLFPPKLVNELFSKVKGKSVLAKVSKQDPIPQEGLEYFVFNLEGNAQIVGEGEQIKAGKATTKPKVVKPYEIVYQARVSNKFLKMNFLLKYPEKFKGNIYPLTLPFLSSINDLVVLL